jgi:mono/diheme cytochrome c family protein
MRWITTAVLACGVIAAVSAAPDQSVTPVAGPSWLHRLGILYRDTSLGRGAGRYGPGPGDLATDRKPLAVTLSPAVTVTGAELYRVNCQACHRAEGTGAPPEIKSVLPAVQGSTLREMRGKLTREQFDERMAKGGQKMPPRDYLQRADIDILYAYLTTLGGTAAKPAGTKETISADRLGEQVVKGTCHICHDATGPAPSAKALLEGARPSLAGIMTNTSILEFVNKVERGAPAMMGEPVAAHRGRMPVFYYLTDNELAAAYKYLHAYPPKP